MRERVCVYTWTRSAGAPEGSRSTELFPPRPLCRLSTSKGLAEASDGVRLDPSGHFTGSLLGPRDQRHSGCSHVVNMLCSQALDDNAGLLHLLHRSRVPTVSFTNKSLLCLQGFLILPQGHLQRKSLTQPAPGWYTHPSEPGPLSQKEDQVPNQALQQRDPCSPPAPGMLCDRPQHASVRLCKQTETQKNRVEVGKRSAGVGQEGRGRAGGDPAGA